MTDWIRSGGVKFHPDLAPLLTDIDQAQPHPENDNNGDVDAIGHSIDMNGMYGPIKVQRSTGYIVGGNHTWMACKEREATYVPMVFLDVDDTTARRILLDDNHTARLARREAHQTLELLRRIEEAEGTIDHTTYNQYDVEVLEQMGKQPVEFEQAHWPVFSVALHPQTLKSFYYMTREADTDADRIEVLMRLAGWDGR